MMDVVFFPTNETRLAIGRNPYLMDHTSAQQGETTLCPAMPTILSKPFPEPGLRGELFAFVEATNKCHRGERPTDVGLGTNPDIFSLIQIHP